MTEPGRQNSDFELVSIIYLSHMTVPFDSTTLSQLATDASLANERVSVTGYLTFNESSFTQYLEGPEAAVTNVFDRIRADERHDVTRTVLLGDTARRFPDWSMKLISPLRHAVDGPIQTIHELLALGDSEDAVSEPIRRSLNDLVSMVSRMS